MISYRSLAELLLAAPSPEGCACRIVAVDGFSGSGKSSFAARVGRELGAPVFAMDDVIPGWDGLAASIDIVLALILEPLARGRTARWQRYDWDELAHQEHHQLGSCPALILDGCGSGARALAPYLTQIVWIDAPLAEREARVRARWNWYQYEPYRELWTQQEDDLQRVEGTAARAGLTVDNRDGDVARDHDVAFLGMVNA